MSAKTKQSKARMPRFRRPNLHLRVGFTEQDIIAVQNGDTKAWNRIRSYFMPRIHRIAYAYRPYDTMQDCIDRQHAAESALLKAVMTFRFRV